MNKKWKGVDGPGVGQCPVAKERWNGVEWEESMREAQAGILT